jgi:plastocyanin
MQTRTSVPSIVRALVVAAALSLGLGACGSDDDSSDGAASDDGGTTTTAGGLDVNQGDIIVIDDFTFGDGAPVEIQTGELITWQNDDSIRHTVTDDTDNPEFSSSAIQPDDTFSITFDEAGTFQYHCSIHPDRMQGELVITDAS